MRGEVTPCIARKDGDRWAITLHHREGIARRVYLSAEVAAAHGAEWTGPLAPDFWDQVPELEV